METDALVETVEKQTAVFPLFPQRLENAPKASRFPQLPQPLLLDINIRMKTKNKSKWDPDQFRKPVALPN